MKLFRTFISLAAALAIALLLAVTMAWSAREADRATHTSSLAEYPIPTPGSEPFRIAVESPGRVWFTMPGADAIGRLIVTSTVDFRFDTYPLAAGSDPYDLAIRAGDVWFTERGRNRLGRLNMATGAVTEYVIPTANSQPTGIALAPGGDIWFTETAGNKVARFNPGTLMFTEYPYVAYDGSPVYAGPAAISVQNNDTIWFTAPEIHRIAALKPSTGQITVRISVGDFGMPLHRPGDLLVDSYGTVWITVPEESRVGVNVPGTQILWYWYPLGTGGGAANLTATVQDGKRLVWVTEPESSRVAQIGFTTSLRHQYTREHLLPSAGAHPQGVAVDANGTAWITDSASNTIVSWSSPYFLFSRLPAVFKN